MILLYITACSYSHEIMAYMTRLWLLLTRKGCIYKEELGCFGLSAVKWGVKINVSKSGKLMYMRNKMVESCEVE